MPDVTDLQKVAQWAKSNRAAPPDVHNAACRLLDKLNGPNGATEDTPPGRFAAGLRMIGCAVADAKNATQQDFALTGSETLGPNQEGCNDPGCSRVECLHLGTCWEDEFWSEGPNGDAPETAPESHRDGRTPQTVGTPEGREAAEAQEAPEKQYGYHFYDLPNIAGPHPRDTVLAYMAQDRAIIPAERQRQANGGWGEWIDSEELLQEAAQ